jgi:NAD(P)-dependent dehydrogenase (short-subunit alcohol dehydrogenase family)
MTAGIFEKFGDKLAGNSLLGRVGEPADIAGLAIYLSSRAGGYVNATVIAVDGGTITNHLHS